MTSTFNIENTFFDIENTWTIKYSAPNQITGRYKYLKSSCEIRDVDSDELLGIFSMPRAGTETFHAKYLLKNSSSLSLTISIITDEIQKSENATAIFVLPSQLNGAEYPHHTYIVSNIDTYNRDSTGGPRGQQSVHPAVGQFILDIAENETRRG